MTRPIFLAPSIVAALLAACVSQEPAAHDLTTSDFATSDRATFDRLVPDHFISDHSHPDIDQTQCLHGSAFISCPGVSQPKIFCSAQRCKWISTGVAVGEYAAGADTSCTCTAPTCPTGSIIEHFIYSRGTEPWTRDRDLNIDVKIDKSIGPGTTEFTCANCTGACLPGDTPCNANPAGVVLRECPGTCFFLLGTLGGLYGWHLEIEVDFGFTPPKARACVLPFTDAVSCKPGVPAPNCATAGALTVNGASDPSTAGIFDFQFQSGLAVKGTFPAK